MKLINSKIYYYKIKKYKKLLEFKKKLNKKKYW